VYCSSDELVRRKKEKALVVVVVVVLIIVIIVIIIIIIIIMLLSVVKISRQNTYAKMLGSLSVSFVGKKCHAIKWHRSASLWPKTEKKKKKPA